MSSAFRSMTASFVCDRKKSADDVPIAVGNRDRREPGTGNREQKLRRASVPGSPFPFPLFLYSRPAVFFEGLDEILSDRVRRATLDLPALKHEHDLAVLHERDLWRGRRVPGEVAACTLGRV